MMTSQPASWEQVRRHLTKVIPAFSELEPGGPLLLDLGHDGWLLEVTPDSRLVCQYGVDMDDVKAMMSEGTTEDLGTDELAKQAKYFLQPTVSKFRSTLVADGFAEHTELNEEYVAVLFSKSVDLNDLPGLTTTIRACQQHFA